MCSRNRARLEQARHEFEVGNLYFNRKITGAIVGVQPFGGYNMSGTDSKECDIAQSSPMMASS